MSWLVTGGAGYIGAHVVRALLAEGLRVVVLDDLSSGRRDRLPPHVPLHVGSVGHPQFVSAVMAEHAVTGVVHLAAKKQVLESARAPLLYYRENVGGCESLLQAMSEQPRTPHLLFSSSAAVYGAAQGEQVREDDPLEPVNPYGFTKLVCERMIRDVGAAIGVNWIALRYFNVAGTSAPGLDDDESTNLIPIVVDDVLAGRRPVVFGNDYPTPDGTCVRDFIHVADLARAHVLAAVALVRGRYGSAFNVGTGRGASVREVLSAIEKVAGRGSDPLVVGRRPGDPAQVVADPGRIRAELGWRPRLGLDAMVASAWAGRCARWSAGSGSFGAAGSSAAG